MSYLSGVHYASQQISELLLQGNKVVCDRYYYSTLAYFSDLLEAASVDVSNLLQPDYIFMLVCEESVRQSRAVQRGELNWAELLCAQDNHRTRILNAYSQFDLSPVDTSSSTVEQAVASILSLMKLIRQKDYSD